MVSMTAEIVRDTAAEICTFGRGDEPQVVATS